MTALIEWTARPVHAVEFQASRTLPCACGGVLTAHVNDDAIRAAVTEHQRTPRHRAWWLRISEVQARVAGTPVPDELLIRGKRCPCGNHG